MSLIRHLERVCEAPWTAAALLPLSPASPAGAKNEQRRSSPSAFAFLLFVILHSSFVISSAAVPSLLNHQGRIAVNNVNFEGTGLFKFALVNTTGTTSYWSNDGTSTAGSQPTAAVSLTVTKGLYAVLLGDTALANMTAVPASVFDNADVRLRVWFNDGTNGFQQITPDQRLAASPFAINAAKAESVPNGSITGAMLADGSVSSTKIVNGAVGTSQLATNAVQAANIATGAVGSSQLAAGSVTTAAMADSAITTAKLAANFAAGTAVEGTISSINNTSNVLSFSVPFPAPFATAPGITFGRPGWSLGSVTTTGFTATYAGYSPSLVATPGNASATSVASVSGRPAIAYYDNPSTTLKFAIAANRDGSGGWTILTLDAAGTGRDCSLIIVNGNPAVSYYDATNSDLKFVRALDAAGSTWAAPQTLDTTGNVGQHTCLRIINGSPAISYYDVTNGNLKFIRASDATGSTWSSPVVVDAAAGNVGQFTSLEVVSGNPAIAYYDATAGDLLFVRASDSNGTAWAAPAVIDGAANNVGQYASLAVVGGNPAIAYHDVSNLDLKYVRALDATGGTWGTPLTIDSSGTVGLYSSLKIVNGLPMIASQGVDNARYSCRLWRNLSEDSTGTWSFVVLNLFVPQTNAGQRNSLAAINGAPAVSYIESSTGKLQYATVPDFAWTASDGTVSPIQATAFSSPLSGDITGGQGSTTISSNAVDSAKIMDGSISNADISSSAAIADTKLATISSAGKVANSATTGTSANAPNSLVLRDASGDFSAGTITAALNGNASSATNFTGSLGGDVTGTQGTTAIAAATVTGKALTGFSSTTGSITAADTILGAINKLDGNLALKSPLASPDFTGNTGVGGVGAPDTSFALTLRGTNTSGDSGILMMRNSANSPEWHLTIRSGGHLDLSESGVADNRFFLKAGGDVGIGTASPASRLHVVGTVTAAAFSGDGAALTGVTATNFTGSLIGDVTGTQSATSISAATVTGKALAGFASTTGTITAADTILSAINKLNGNVALRAPLASPTFTGTVSGTFSGNGAALTNLNGASIGTGTIGSTQITDLSIVNADVSNSAAIAYSKLNLAGGIVNADISASAAIPDSKLATIATAGKVANSATTGTSANTPSTLVLRDATGNFSAGTITGTFVGDGSGLTGVTVSTVPLANVIAPPVKPVVAWGKNSSGQTTVPALANVAAVAAGTAHSIALLDAGTVVQWGSIAAAPGTAVNVTHIAAGAEHNLARKSDGTVIAWGDNTYGQSTVPGGITTATNVSAGEKHGLVLKADGTLAAWGDNTFGQTTIPGTATNVTAIACGYDHNLALKSDGTVVAWGRNDVGQTTVPGGLTNVVAIAAGAYHSLAVKNDGTVVAWGWDSGGQSTVPVGLTGVSKIAGGYAFSLALKTDGTLVAWGDNTDGQTIIPPTATQSTHIAAGANHALALRADFIPAQVARLDQDNVFTGNVGIKRTASTNSLEVEGQASKTTAGNWLANSDRRIKTDVLPITGALEKLSQVRLVDFKYTDDYRAAHPGIEDKRYLNVIAQEFAKVFPEDVKRSGEKLPDGSDILQVDTYPLTIYSAAAVQELHRENEALKKKLAEQEERLRKLEAALSK